MDGKLRNMASVYIIHKNKMLLLYRLGSRVVSPSWCSVGGHFEKEELNDARAAMLRELNEEIELTEDKLENLSLRYVTLRLINGEIRQNYYFFANLREGTSVKLDCYEGKLDWVNFSELHLRDMPFTAKYVLKHYLEKGRDNNLIYVGVAEETEVVFTPLYNYYSI